jgi:phosphomannomutase/phosphoglucomutase
MTRLFGTNGIRGVVGEDMTASLGLDVGRAIGTLLAGGKMAIGQDTRTTSPMLKAAVVSGLVSAGCSVLDLGTAPSPSIQYFVKGHDLAGGVIITASHNPAEYNGIKVLDAEGMEIPRATEESIEDIFFQRKFSRPGWDSLGDVQAVSGCNRAYLDAILRRVDAEGIRRSRLRVVLDCANGASCLTSPYLLRELGCRLTSLNAEPDGTFPGHPPEPREEHVGELMEMVVETGAHLGVVHDGDADRVLFVDERGGFVYGDRSLALVAGYVVKRKGGGTVVTPVSSSSCVEDTVKVNGGKVKYTKVGAPLVARTMYEIGATFGGEENGGLIFPEHQYCRDGAMGLAAVLEMMALEEASLSELLSAVPTYHLVKRSVPCPPELRKPVLEALRERLQGREVETIDGVKVRQEDGWFLVRPSGTEAIFRVFSEGRTEERAEEYAREAVSILEKLIDDLMPESSTSERLS